MGNKGALTIPFLSFQYLRRPRRAAKLLCFHIVGGFDPHRPYHLNCNCFKRLKRCRTLESAPPFLPLAVRTLWHKAARELQATRSEKIFCFALYRTHARTKFCLASLLASVFRFCFMPPVLGRRSINLLHL